MNSQMSVVLHVLIGVWIVVGFFACWALGVWIGKNK
jgi:hypothetical protein